MSERIVFRPGEATAQAEQVLLPMIFGAVQGQLLRVAVSMRLPERLAGGAVTVADLARDTGTDPSALRRMLRALARLGVVVEPAPDRYVGTAVTELLRAEAPVTLNHYARMNNSAWLLRVLTELDGSVRGGAPAGVRVLGTDVYGYLQAHPADGAEFNAALTELSQQDARALLAGYDFGTHTTIVDVGGGEGALLRAVLDAHPRPQGILVDLDEVVARAPAVLAPHIAAGRCRITAADFRGAVPGLADLYVLKRVVSTCAMADLRQGLGRIREGIRADGRLLIADPDPDSTYGALLDVLMLVATGGGLRNRAELDALLGASGFRIERSIEAGTTLRAYLAAPI
jgi:hypothetical protein